MHREKASSRESGAPAGVGDPAPELVDDGLPPQAGASRTTAAAAMMAAAVRGAGGRARPGRRVTRVLSFMSAVLRLGG
jgi:hypothetical protein